MPDLAKSLGGPAGSTDNITNASTNPGTTLTAALNDLDATKADITYVDAVAQGLDQKASCRVATTANRTLSGLQTIDGVVCVAGDRVLVKNQTAGAENGIYVVASGAWTRATDADSSAKVTSGMSTFISEGSVNTSFRYVLVTADPIVLGTTALVFSEFGRDLTGVTFTAGAGLTGGGTLAANRTFNVVANADASIVVNADDIQVGVITDAQHGTRAGGTLHAAATDSTAGFMSAADHTTFTGHTTKIGAGAIAAPGTNGTTAADLADAINELAAWSPLRSQLSFVRPKQGSTTLDLGGSVAIQTFGTGTSRTMADTNWLTRRNRLGLVGSTSAGNGAGITKLSLGTGQMSRNTGFQFWTGMGIVAVTANTTRSFMGLAGSGLVISVNAITATTNCIGVGADETKSNMQLIVNDNSGAPVLVDLGASFPARTLNAAYDLWLGCDQLGSTVRWRLRRLDSFVETSGTISSRVLGASAALWAHNTMYNGTDAASVSMDFLGFEEALPLQ